MPTPEEWLALLDKRLEQRRPTIDRHEDYYAGKHRLAFATSKFREAFGSLFSAFADNWCALVVDASVERLSVEGFRFGSDDPAADDDAWRIWQDNELDGQSMLAHTEAVKHGEAFVLVAPGEDGEPVVTVEHPSQCIVACAPGMRRRRLAALKKWIEDDEFLHANVYLPDRVVKFRSKEKWKGAGSKIDWDRRADLLGESEQEHGMAAVPMVALMNEPSMLHGGLSDLHPVIPQQDAVNKLVTDMIVASEFASFRQRWATGIEIPIDPDTGQQLDSQKFLSSVSRMWTVGDPEAKFGEFSASDLGNYVKAIEMMVQHIAAQTRTPPHYLLGQSGAFPSGESLKSTETGLVAKVRRKQLSFGEAWEEVMRLAFRVTGDTERGSARDAEALWRDPESRTTAEQTDAAIKEIACGVPREAVWGRRLGASPQEIERWKLMQADEALTGLLGSPTVPPVTVDGVSAG